jgi:hypothetical protein
MVITDRKIGARKNGLSGDREKSCVKNAELNAPSKVAVSYQLSATGPLLFLSASGGNQIIR